MRLEIQWRTMNMIHTTILYQFVGPSNNFLLFPPESLGPGEPLLWPFLPWKWPLRDKFLVCPEELPPMSISSSSRWFRRYSPQSLFFPLVYLLFLKRLLLLWNVTFLSALSCSKKMFIYMPVFISYIKGILPKWFRFLSFWFLFLPFGFGIL